MVEDFFYKTVFNSLLYHSWYMKLYHFFATRWKIMDLAWVNYILNTGQSSMCLFVLVCAVLIGGFFLFYLELLYLVNNAFFFTIIDIYFLLKMIFVLILVFFLINLFIYLFFIFIFILFLFVLFWFCFCFCVTHNYSLWFVHI